MASQYLIDAYNVIYHVPALRSLLQSNFESAREALIEHVARFCASTGHHATIVFDGQGHKVQQGTPFGDLKGVEVLYSPGHTTADTVIERTIYRAANRRDYIVVSGDRGIRDQCFRMGSLVMTPENFLVKSEESREGVRAHLKASSGKVRHTIEDAIDGESRATLERLKRRLENGET